MANKKISELSSRTPALSDLMIVGDPSSGYSYKCTITALATIIETDIADGYVTIGTTQTISGAKTFSNNLTLTSVANAATTQTKFLTLNGSNVVNYRTGAEVLADIGGQASLSGTGLVKSTSGTISYITDNSSNWNTAYNDSIVSAAVSGTTTKTLTLTQQDGGTLTASWSDLNTDAVTSVFGRTGAVVATEGDYSLNLLSDVTLTSPSNGQVLKYNGTTWVNDTDANTGTVTSVAATGGTGISVSGSPITSSGTLTITNTAPDQTVVLTAGTGISVSGTYPNFTITNSSPSSGGTVTSVGLSSATSGVTIGSSPITTSGTITLAIATASGSQQGLLSSTDWTTFNNKQNAITLTTTGTSGAATLVGSTLNIPQYQAALTNPVTGTGTTNYIPKFTSSSAIGTGSLYDDGTNIGLGTTTPDNFTNYRVFEVKATTGGILQSSNGTQKMRMYVTGQGTYFGSVSNDFLVFNTNDVERMRLTSGGSLGIGTSNPSELLSILGTGDTKILVETSKVGADANAALSLKTASDGHWIIQAGNAVSGGLRYVQVGYGERMRLDASGNLGLGTSSPNASFKATFNGLYGIRIQSADVNNSAINIGSDTGNGYAFIDVTKSGTGSYLPLRFSTSDAERMRLDASGNLGLGVVPSAWGNGNIALEYADGIGLARESSGQFSISQNAYKSATGWRYKASSIATSLYNQYQGNFYWNSAAGGTADAAISYTTRMTLDASGNLGLSVTPSAWGGNTNKVLEFANGVSISGNLAISTLNLITNAYSTNGGNSWIYKTSAAATAYLQSAGQHLWYNAPSGTAGTTATFTQAMTLDASGRLGIGTTSPSEKLEVNGAIKTAAPSGGNAAAWKLGERVASSSLTLNTTQYIQLDINGTLYTLATVNLS